MESVIEFYSIGWICALQEEYDAACEMLDEELGPPEDLDIKDSNTYVFGTINGHGMIIGSLGEGQYGTISAATVAKDMIRSFPNLRFALMVGIGGGAPNDQNDIRLGDVVVSVPCGQLGGVVQFDLGKRLPDGSFLRTGHLNKPPDILLTATRPMQRLQRSPNMPDKIAAHIKRMENWPEFQRPAHDKLYQTNYLHRAGANCQSCQDEGLKVRRKRTINREIMVHYGIIASSNTVMKDALERDRYANDPHLKVLCFEMEAAGLMNSFPCLVIRGICDYCDSHKNDDWHNYAALTAAAYARQLLFEVKASQIKRLPGWSEIKELLQEIDNKITDLSEDNREIKHGVSSIVLDTQEISRRQRTEEEMKILKWLTPVEYGPQQSDYLSRRHPGTGIWLLESNEYSNWLEATGETLFCHGIPGAGKTILTAVAIDDLTTRFRDNPNVGVAYVYCNFKRQNEQRTRDLLVSLLKMLSRSRPSLPGKIKDLHDRHKEKKTELTFEEVLEALQSVVLMYQKVFIAVDALDEMQGLDFRANFLKEIFKLQAKHKINIFATSRPIQEIASRFVGASQLEIRAHDEDVLQYLDVQISDSKRSVLEKCREEIKRSITQSVNGMFLLAQLLFKSISAKTTIAKVKRALVDLPTGVDAYTETYEEAVKRINSQHPDTRNLAMSSISWITCAMRPLSTLEIQYALAVEPECKELDEDNLPSIEDIESACAGLVTSDQESGIIRLVHYTTQQYFEKTQKNWFPEADRHIMETCISYLSLDVFKNAAREIRRQENERELLRTEKLRKQYQQRVERCNKTRDSDAVGEDRNISNGNSGERKSEMRYDSGSDESDYSYHTDQSYGNDQSYEHYEYRDTEESEMSHGNEESEDSNEDEERQGSENHEKGDVNGKTPDGTLRVGKTVFDTFLDNNILYDYAARNWGHHARKASVTSTIALTFLYSPFLHLSLRLALGREYDSRWNVTPLHVTAHFGILKITQALLGEKEDVNARDMGYETPLAYAAGQGYDSIVKLLLAHRNINPDPRASGQDSWEQTPLALAARSGHDMVVRTLIDDGRADVNAEFSAIYHAGRTPLSTAAEYGHEKVVRILLQNEKVERDYMIDQKKTRPTALELAANMGHEAVVQLLLKDPKVNPDSKCASPDDTNIGGLTPLAIAASQGHYGIVKLLVETGRVDINSKSGSMVPSRSSRTLRAGGLTPLTHAVIGGHDAVVELLLAQDGIEPDPAAYLESCERRRRRGSDESPPRWSGRTPLSYAAERGNEVIVRLLLRHPNIDPNSKTKTPLGNGPTPLGFAAKEGHTGIVKILLATPGVDMNWWSDDGWPAEKWYDEASGIGRGSPLCYAALYGFGDIVKLFLTEDKLDIPALALQNAAKTNRISTLELLIERQSVSPDDWGYYGPALMAASEYGKEKAVKLLLERSRIDINRKDDHGGAPLHYAVKKRRYKVAKLLLAQKPIDVNQFYNGRTVLMTAAKTGDERMVRMLLDHEDIDIDLKEPSSPQRTAFSYAKKGRHRGIIDLIKSHKEQSDMRRG